MKKYLIIFLPLMMLFLILILILISPVTLKKSVAANKDKTEDLPVVGTYENLKALLEKAGQYGMLRYGKVMVMEDAVQATAAAGGPLRVPAAVKGAEATTPGDYATTNVQVQGVDEADIVKTDGSYIYQVNNQQVVVARVYPPEGMQVTSILHFDAGFTPRELYVDDRYLVVIGNSYNYNLYPAPGRPVPEIYPPPRYGKSTVKAIVYDLADKSNLKLLREIELEGYYVSSRKIGPALYLVANKNIDYYILKEGEANPLPTYRDSASGGGFTSISYEDIRYFPGFVEPNYMLIAGINLDRLDQEASINAYLGAGENIYASLENLYVAVSRYESRDSVGPAAHLSIAVPGVVPEGEWSTVVYRFALDQGRAEYTGRGEVAGNILNQFSMDEYKGYFRIATTRGDIWRNDENTAKNNIYILDQSLTVVGRLEGIAPGERIYAARFMGERCYLVTFKNVDPFFVVDLQDPKEPKILGALKIPGYSDYLHPYDENHIIGFGKDTVEISQLDRQGKSMGSMAFYQGMKMALFDVMDVQNPVEKFKVTIGDRGTDSELLHNHKALLFARDKNLLAFPVTVMELKEPQANNYNTFPAYGEFTFQGAYVYNIDLVDGFTLKGRISHLNAQDYQQAGQYFYNSDKNIERILYIGDTLYTVSKSMIKASNLGDLTTINNLVLTR
ncbi:beta-propeller domain-containing protein [Moorella sulfitireducens (nom. illeg.)]|uniref:beta-propeller domain-containing protein n=1 Tax=Neomoorella sulfitireducens TaxID=2972948 RepID=UPI0021AC344D|nr:beta-propeller domain-containing protein [Moorella sulfitireducens]